MEGEHKADPLVTTNPWLRPLDATLPSSIVDKRALCKYHKDIPALLSRERCPFSPDEQHASYILNTMQQEGTIPSVDDDETRAMVVQALGDSTEDIKSRGWPHDGAAPGEDELWGPLAVYNQARDHASALRFVLAAAKDPDFVVTSKFILEVFTKIMRHAEESPGVPFESRARFRAKGESVKSGYRQFPSVCDGGCMEKLVTVHIISHVDWNATKKHPIAAACDALHAVTELHPFNNGNGRIGRMMFAFVLVRAGVPFPVFMDVGVSKSLKFFVTALRKADSGRPGYLYGIGLTSVATQLCDKLCCC